ncbi:hypothetical protein LCGC14_1766200, partial [marine sediment metagenome]
MTAPVVEGTNTSGADNVAYTTHTINLQGVVSGHLGLIDWANFHSANSPGTLGTGSWTILVDSGGHSTASTFHTRVMYKQLDGTEGASDDFTTANECGFAAGFYRVSGAKDPATQAPYFGTFLEEDTATPNPPSLTPGGGSDDYLYVACGGCRRHIYDGWPTGYGEGNLGIGHTGGLAGTGMGMAGKRTTASTSDDPGTMSMVADNQTWVNTIAVPPSAGLGGNLGLLTETNLAQAFGKAKAKAIGLVSESELAQTLGKAKALAIGILTEADLAQAFGRAKAKIVGLISETDQVFVISTGGLSANLGLQLEADLAQPLSKAKAKALGLNTETDLAQSLAAQKSDVLGLPLEVDSVFVMSAAKAKALGLVSETDVPLAMSTGALIVVTNLV